MEPTTKAVAVHKVSAAAAASNAHLAELGSNVVYLMGLSFVLGSFFTILVLILLDFMRRDQPGER